MSKINIGELARQLAGKKVLGQTEAELFVRKMFEVANEGLESDKQVKIKWFGTFKVQAVKDRESVDVNTGERIIIEGRDKISFTPDSILKEIINKPFAQFETVVVNDGVDFDNIDQKFGKNEAEEADETPAEPQGSFMESQEMREESQNALTEPEEHESAPVDKESEHLKFEEHGEEANCALGKGTADSSFSVVGESVDNSSLSAVILDESKDEDIEQKIVGASSVDKHHFVIPRYAVAIAVFVVVVLVAGMGYLAFSYGKMQAQRDELALLLKQHQRQSPKTVVKKPTNLSQEEILRKKAVEDSLRLVKEAEAVEAAEATKADEAAKKSETKSSGELVDEAVGKDNTAQYEMDETNYDRDPRVRTGAYRIVGVQQVVVAKAGQTLSNLSSQYLGPGMECYLEALNGSGHLKEGQKVKIPKLVLKKKK